MKNWLKTLSITLILGISPLLFFACSNGNPEPATKYTITFNIDNSTNDVQVEENKLVTKPTDPTKENCTFCGWYEDKTFETAWDFDNKKVTADATLYAYFVENPKLIYNLLGGRTNQATEQYANCLSGQTFTLLTSSQVEKVGFNFIGWNTQKDGLGNNFENSLFVSQNTTLYAMWEKKTSANSLENAYLDTLAKISELEYMAELYKKTHSSSLSSKSLALAYIRSSRYNSSQWNLLAGTLPTNFERFISENTALDLSTLKSLNYLEKTEGEKIDFVHMMATLNMFTNSMTNNNSDLGGWGGDLAQLVNEIKGNNVGLDELKTLAIGKLSSTSSSFNIHDMLADLDAVSIDKIISTTSYSIAKAIDSYYQQNELNRKSSFITNTFGNITRDVETLQSAIKTKMTNNILIKVLFSSYGISYDSTHANHFDACCYAFATYLLS